MVNANALEQNTVPERPNSASFKKRMARHFGKAAPTYDAAAHLQRRIATRTMMLLPSEKKPASILDLGSGTGQQAIELAKSYPEALVTGMDISQGMADYARLIRSDATNSHWMVGDIEHLPFRSQSFDIVYSSLAIQWCDLRHVLHEVKRVLKPGGRFVFSSLAKDTLWELQAAWRLVDVGTHTNAFLSFAEQKQYVDVESLKRHAFLCQIEKQHYANIYSLLKELKASGVNTVSSPNKGLMTRKKLHALKEAYEPLRQQKGLPLSYQVVYGHLEKRNE